MNKNSIEEDIKIVENYLANSAMNEIDSNFFKNSGWETVDLEIPKSMQHILSDYKRVLKENEIYKKNSEIMSKENLSTAEQLKVEIKENFRLKNQLENNRKEYQETYKDVREELKELKKENEELLQEKINNQKIIVLAQNDMLNYQAGFEDGKNGRISAVQSIIENQQYYIIRKQMEKYEERIKMLQKENEELKLYNNSITLQLEQMTTEKFKEGWIHQSEFKDFIPVQKVKDKIEELQNGPLKINENNKYYYETEAYNKIIIQVLQELLEGRK